MNIIKKTILFFIPIRFIFNNHNPVLVYHSLGSKSDFQDNIDHVNLKTLEKQLKFVQKYCEFVPIDELTNSKNKRGLASITIDDGYKNVIDESMEIFENLKIPITIFINSGNFKGKVFWRDKVRYLIQNNMVRKFIDNSKLFNNDHFYNFYNVSKNQLFNSIKVEKEIDNFFLKENINISIKDKFCFDNEKYLIKHSLISYGNHTSNHYLLSSLNKEEQYKEIFECKNYLDRFNINKSNIFCVPFGGADSYNEDTLSILKQLNYKTFLLTENRFNKFYKNDKIYRLMPNNSKIDNFFKKHYLRQMIGK